MFEGTLWGVKVLLFACIFILKYCEGNHDVTYEGRHYVPEGSPFTISCVKSSYGVPKWTRNGVAVDYSDDFRAAEEGLPDDRVRMGLTVERARWKHRGHYKCDPLSVNSHWIEVVPSKESDPEILQQARVQLRPYKTLKLVCDQEENAIFPINWYKDGSRVLASEEEDERVRMEGRTLWISRSTESDTGEYTCVIEMSGLSYPFADHLGSRIKVTDAARVDSFPRQMRPILNRNLSLECKIRGFPVPRVAWLVDGIPVEEFRLNDTRFGVTDNPAGLPDSVFQIMDVQYGDDHHVTCTAENADGSDHTTTRLAVREEHGDYFLKVSFHPLPNDTASEGRIYYNSYPRQS